jgi:agmatinase
MNKKTKEPNFLGLETSYSNSQVIILPLPFEITTSVVSGCNEAPSQILEASESIDFLIPQFKDVILKDFHIYMEKPNSMFLKLNFPFYQEIIEKWKDHYYDIPLEEVYSEKFVISELYNINREFEKLYDFSYKKVKEYLENGKLFGVIGGEHSVNFGVVKAVSDYYGGNFSILQIDAHCDLKNKYLGIEYSHASAMRNIFDNIPLISLTQIGIRDLDKEELECSEKFDNIFTMFDYDSFNLDVSQIISLIAPTLNENIYLSFDIDGLDPSLCPNTGTPVPGGFSYNKILAILEGLFLNKGKKLIGFDLVEIGSNSEGGIDANVGARLVYFLSTLMVKSNNKI